MKFRYFVTLKVTFNLNISPYLVADQDVESECRWPGIGQSVQSLDLVPQPMNELP